MKAARTILVTGATGFVGSAVLSSLQRAGWRCRGLTRDVAAARATDQHPGRTEWVRGDVDDPRTLRKAFTDCDAALYLVHAMGEGGDFHARELHAARTFLRAADDARLRRIVYLGGMAPDGTPSAHLRSRLEVGAILRRGAAVTIELRASMIVGEGSLSWQIVRDLAARLPVMVLPRWLESRTQPVAIDDVVQALVRAIDLDVPCSQTFDLPGPEVLTGKQILMHTARALGLRQPRVIEVPYLSPKLSALCMRLVTRAKWTIAREVVVGLTRDIIARDGAYWRLIGHTQLQRYDEVARRTVEQERRHGPVPGLWGELERLIALSV